MIWVTFVKFRNIYQSQVFLVATLPAGFNAMKNMADYDFMSYFINHNCLYGVEKIFWLKRFVQQNLTINPGHNCDKRLCKPGPGTVCSSKTWHPPCPSDHLLPSLKLKRLYIVQVVPLHNSFRKSQVSKRQYRTWTAKHYYCLKSRSFHWHELCTFQWNAPVTAQSEVY